MSSRRKPIKKEELNQGPVQHDDLADETLKLARWAWRKLKDHITWCRSCEDWELGFLRDSFPEREIAFWLMSAYAYSEFTHRHPEVDPHKVFAEIQGVAGGVKPGKYLNAKQAKRLENAANSLPEYLTDPDNFTEEGQLTVGPDYLR